MKILKKLSVKLPVPVRLNFIDFLGEKVLIRTEKRIFLVFSVRNMRVISDLVVIFVIIHYICIIIYIYYNSAKTN